MGLSDQSSSIERENALIEPASDAKHSPLGGPVGEDISVRFSSELWYCPDPGCDETFTSLAKLVAHRKRHTR